MTTPGPRIFLSAGEPSGDLHAAPVVRALLTRYPNAVVDAFGGPAMAEAGATICYPMERYTAGGLVEIIDKLPAHYRLLRTLRRRFLDQPYDLVLPVDYPGFHLRLVAAAHAAGSKVLYYIPPHLWAWWPGRARQLAANVDRLAVILPFERQFYTTMGLQADYVGHPLIDRPRQPSRAEARHVLGVSADAKVLAIFPGSRGQEIQRHWGRLRQVATLMLEEGRCQRALVAGTESGSYPDAGPLEIHRDRSADVLAAADAAVVKSGTSTLEAALAGVPMVVMYRVNPITFWLAMRLTKLRTFSLVNLVGERAIVSELIQSLATVERIAERLRPLLDPDSPEARAQRQGLAEVRDRLGPPGAADRVAALAADLLGR